MFGKTPFKSYHDKNNMFSILVLLCDKDETNENEIQ